MIRTPHAPHTLLQTNDRLLHHPQLLTTRIAQQPGLDLDLLLHQPPHTDRLLPAIDVVADDDRVFARARGHGDFDLGVGAREGGEGVAEEGTVVVLVAGREKKREWDREMGNGITHFIPFEDPAQSQ